MARYGAVDVADPFAGLKIKERGKENEGGRGLPTEKQAAREGAVAACGRRCDCQTPLRTARTDTLNAPTERAVAISQSDGE